MGVRGVDRGGLVVPEGPLGVTVAGTIEGGVRSWELDWRGVEVEGWLIPLDDEPGIFPTFLMSVLLFLRAVLSTKSQLRMK
jgi:hypothetical protein